MRDLRRREYLFLLLSVAASSILAIRVRQLSAAVALANRAAMRSDNALHALRGQRLKLIATTTHIPLRGGISGYNHTTGSAFRAADVADGLYYITDPDCQASVRDLPFLNRLSTQFPGLVIALSPGGQERLAGFIRDHNLGFPVIGSPQSFLLELLPRGVTPVTAIVSNGRITTFIEGSLSDDDKVSVAAFLEKIHPPAVRAGL